MSEIVLGEPLASLIQQEAEAEGIKVEDLVEAALRHYHFQAQRKKIDSESEWWRSAPSDVRARYAGEFVAVHNREVVDHDRDEERLRERVRRKYGKTSILLTPAEGQREMRIVNAHIEFGTATVGGV